MRLGVRSRRQRLGTALVAASLLAGVLVVAGATSSSAARLVTHGWWWRAQTGSLVGLPVPPHVPEGGLAVGNNADGATAISAVRFEVAENETNPILHLKVSRLLGGPEVKMAACHSGSAWFGTQAGAWNDKPQAACSLGSVQGVASEDGSEWTFPVGSLQLEGLIDVVIVPADDAQAPFEISFERPTAASLATTIDTGGSDDGGFSGPPPPPPDFFIPSESGFGDFAPPGGQQPFAPALGPDEQQPTEDAPVSRSQQRTFGTSTAGLLADDAGDPRPLALLVLVVGLIAGALMMREPLPAPRLLGPTAAHGVHRRLPAPEPEVRGLGRFASERRGTPPRLF